MLINQYLFLLINKVSDVVKNDGVKRYKYNSKIKDIEDKIPVITN